jgi:hypothetical protein
MKVTTIGIDLAKNVFTVHGVDERGKATLKRQIKRAQAHGATDGAPSPSSHTSRSTRTMRPTRGSRPISAKSGARWP